MQEFINCNVSKQDLHSLAREKQAFIITASVATSCFFLFMKSFFFTSTTTANGSVIKLFTEIYCDFIETEKEQCFETSKDFLMHFTNFCFIWKCYSIWTQLRLPEIIPVIATSLSPAIEWVCWLVRFNL